MCYKLHLYLICPALVKVANKPKCLHLYSNNENRNSNPIFVVAFKRQNMRHQPQISQMNIKVIRWCFGKGINSKPLINVFSYAWLVDDWRTHSNHLPLFKTGFSVELLESEFASHCGPSRLSLHVYSQHFLESASSKIYTAHLLMNQRDTGGRGMEEGERWMKQEEEGRKASGRQDKLIS